MHKKVSINIMGMFFILCLGLLSHSTEAAVVKFYEDGWDAPIPYKIIPKVAVGRGAPTLSSLPDHVLPMPPMGTVWRRQPDNSLTLHLHRDYAGPLPNVEILTFSDGTQQKFAYLNRQGGVTVEGYTDYVATIFTPGDRRYPFKEFTDGAIPYWRAHILDHSSTMGDTTMAAASTYLVENFHPEPFGYWSQNGANGLMGGGKGYKRLLIYPFNPEIVTGMNGKRKIAEIFLPTGAIFSQYAPGRERIYQGAYNIPYALSHPIHHATDKTAAGILASLQDKRNADVAPFAPYIRPVVLYDVRNRHELSRNFFYEYTKGVDRGTYKTATLTDQEGLRLHGENEADGIEGKMFHLLGLLSRGETIPPHMLQYVSRSLGHHALFLDDIHGSRNKVVDARWVDALQERVVSNGFKEDDSLIDILRRIDGNQADVSKRTRVTFKVEDTFVPAVVRRAAGAPAAAGAGAGGSAEFKSSIAVPRIAVTLDPLVKTSDLGAKDLCTALNAQLTDIGGDSRPHLINCFISGLSTKDMNLVAGVIKVFLDTHKHHSIHLQWALPKDSHWNPETIRERLNNLILKLPGRLSHEEVSPSTAATLALPSPKLAAGAGKVLPSPATVARLPVPAAIAVTPAVAARSLPRASTAATLPLSARLAPSSRSRLATTGAVPLELAGAFARVAAPPLPPTTAGAGTVVPTGAARHATLALPAPKPAASARGRDTLAGQLEEVEEIAAEFAAESAARRAKLATLALPSPKPAASARGTSSLARAMEVLSSASKPARSLKLAAPEVGGPKSAVARAPVSTVAETHATPTQFLKGFFGRPYEPVLVQGTIQAILIDANLMTGGVLAEKLGVSATSVSNLKAGRASDKMNREIWAKFAGQTGIGIQRLLGISPIQFAVLAKALEGR